jgi:SAM-dependent methyltransferase
MALLSRLMERLWADAEAAYRREILASLPVNRTVRLLDVGCEDGAWTEKLRAKLAIPARQVSGLEIVPELAERSRKRGFDVRSGDLDAPWPFEDSGFDVVHANQVIEHVQRLDHFAAELKRVLAPRGLAIVCTENLASWHNIGALLLGLQPFSLTNISVRRRLGNRFAKTGEYLALGDSFLHVHVMTLSALRDLLQAHGFLIERSWGHGYHPLPHFLATGLARLDPRHAHFIGAVARIAAVE